jgi:hypothetical protein
MEQEIRQARALYSVFGQRLMKERGIAQGIQAYQAAISETYARMADLGIIEACTQCATTRAGSCCFHGVEEWYDHVVLLINLLLGVELPETREMPGGCLFLGIQGCKLVARNAFCVNYLCPGLIDSLAEGKKKDLLSVSGKELFCGWELEKALHSRLHKPAPRS